MKKFFAVFIALIFLFTVGCKNENKTHELKSVVPDKDNVMQNSSPRIILATVDDLREIKLGLETMQPEEFEEYMHVNKNSQSMNGMWDYQSSKIFMEELEKTTIALLDGDEDCFDMLLFYWERNEIQVVMPLTQNNRLIFNIYTPLRNRNEEKSLTTSENLAFEKSIIKDGVVAQVYSSIQEKGMHTEIEIDDTKVFFWATEKQSIEEFEADFARLEFVKIGDLLERSNTETTKGESVSHTGLSDEEETTEINIATELSVESVTYDLLEAETTE